MTATSTTVRASMTLLCRVLGVLVLAMQLTAPLLPGSVNRPSASWAGSSRDWLAEQAICHAEPASDDGSDRQPLTPASGHEHDCGLCSVCRVVTVAALLPLGDTPFVPQPLLLDETRPQLPPATGPPSVLRAAASPRGPPTASV